MTDETVGKGNIEKNSLQLTVLRNSTLKIDKHTSEPPYKQIFWIL